MCGQSSAKQIQIKHGAVVTCQMEIMLLKVLDQISFVVMTGKVGSEVRYTQQVVLSSCHSHVMFIALF